MSITVFFNSKTNNVLYQLRLLRFKLIRKQKSPVGNHFRGNGRQIKQPFDKTVCLACKLLARLELFRHDSARHVGILLWLFCGAPFSLMCVAHLRSVLFAVAQHQTILSPKHTSVILPTRSSHHHDLPHGLHGLPWAGGLSSSDLSLVLCSSTPSVFSITIEIQDCETTKEGLDPRAMPSH